ncbi:MAG: hypothetical protein J6B89_05130 [Bacilli bacterium]|nr:hypothetical protein [Bacilli bacterium]
MMNNMPYQIPNYPPFQDTIDRKILELEERVFQLEKKQRELERKINRMEKPQPNFLSSDVTTDQGLYMM